MLRIQPVHCAGLALVSMSQKHHGCNANQDAEPAPIGDAGHLWKTHFAQGGYVLDVLLDPVEAQRVKDAAQKHSSETHYGVNAAGGHGGYARARTISVKNHAHAKKGCAKRHSQHVGRFDVVIRMAGAVQHQHAKATPQ